MFTTAACVSASPISWSPMVDIATGGRLRPWPCRISAPVGAPWPPDTRPRERRRLRRDVGVVEHHGRLAVVPLYRLVAVHRPREAPFLDRGEGVLCLNLPGRQRVDYADVRCRAVGLHRVSDLHPTLYRNLGRTEADLRRFRRGLLTRHRRRDPLLCTHRRRDDRHGSAAASSATCECKPRRKRGAPGKLRLSSSPEKRLLFLGARPAVPWSWRSVPSLANLRREAQWTRGFPRPQPAGDSATSTRLPSGSRK